MINRHKYQVGQELRFRSSTLGSIVSSGPVRILGYRPSEIGEPVYRVKSELERHERIVRENELTCTT